MAHSNLWEARGERLLKGDFRATAQAQAHLEDFTWLAEAMNALQLSLPLADHSRALFRELIDAGYGVEDHSALVRLFEQITGMEARA